MTNWNSYGLGNHYWTHPPTWEQPDMVTAIVYYSDTNLVGGHTSMTFRRKGK